MLCENLKNSRKRKGYSQEELAIRLHVVRQSVSKWERGLSVPDAEMLVRIAEELDTTVSALLGETVQAETEESTESSELQRLAAKLEVLNGQFARQKETRRRIWHGVFLTLAIVMGVIFLLEVTEQIWLWSAERASIPDADVAIIGGADGPTAILISGETHLMKWIAGVAAALVAVVGIIKTRRR